MTQKEGAGKIDLQDISIKGTALDDFIPDEAERHVAAQKGMKTNSRGRHM